MPTVKFRFKNTTRGDRIFLEAEFEDTPIAAALLKTLSQDIHKAVHVCWSGRCFEIAVPSIELPEGTPEHGESNDFPIGTVFIDPSRKEAGISYGISRWQDVSTPMGCIIVGKVTSGHQILVELGNDFRHNGDREVRVENNI